MNNKPLANENEVLRLKHAAAYLGVSLPTLWRLGETDPDFPKKIHFSQRCCGYLRADLEAYLKVKKMGGVA